MQATIKGNAEVEKNVDLEAIMNDIASLKRDVGALTENLKTGIGNDATGVGRNAAARLSNEARRLYGNFAEQGQHSVKALSRHVEEQPVTSLLIAFAVGMIGSRLLLR